MLVAEKAARDSWPSADGMLEHVRVLAANGARERAAEVLGQHAWLSAFTGGAEALGRAWLAMGDAGLARNFLSRAMMESARSPSPSVLAAMAKVQIAMNNFPAARLLLRRAFAEPVCHEYAALAEYLDASGELPNSEAVATEFGLSARALHELRLAIFAVLEKRGRVREAFALVAAAPGIVGAAGEWSERDGSVPPLDCARLRRMAVRAGEFEDGARLLASLHGTDAPAELAALEAAWAEHRGDREAALSHAERAAELRATSWEFARHAAELCMARDEARKAKAALERFLSVSPSSSEREAALDFWERANRAVAK